MRIIALDFRRMHKSEAENLNVKVKDVKSSDLTLLPEKVRTTNELFFPLLSVEKLFSE